jgi:hypothetical protein
VFGGSNGYWRTDLLRTVRMHGFMLTEDIDSSLRVVEEGGRIANDPALLSLELAPTTLGQLWNQRMRWAQGWFQVSRKHLLRGWRSPHMTTRQKLGMTFLLGWREVYPWVALQILPLLAFLAVKAGGVAELEWLISVLVLASLFTLSVGPGQTLFAYRLAAPEVRRHPRWFLQYLLLASLAYTEWKNVVARVAHIKEAVGERQWKVTPRSTAARAGRRLTVTAWSRSPRAASSSAWTWSAVSACSTRPRGALRPDHPPGQPHPRGALRADRAAGREPAVVQVAHRLPRGAGAARRLGLHPGDGQRP